VHPVSALTIRRRLRRQQRRAAMIFAVLAVAFVIAAHHSGVRMDMHQDAGMSAVAQMCLGVFTAVGAILIAVGLAVLALGRWRPTLTLSPSAPLPASPVPVARARHGPAAVSFLCVSRR
jgi:apolipoprotein N-acyltransferase